MGLDSPIHIAFLVVIMLVVFGAKRLPEMGKSLGSGMRGFKESLGGETPAALTAQTDVPATPAPVALAGVPVVTQVTQVGEPHTSVA